MDDSSAFLLFCAQSLMNRSDGKCNPEVSEGLRKGDQQK